MKAGCAVAVAMLIILAAVIRCSSGSTAGHDPNLPPAAGAALAHDAGDRVYVTASRLNARTAPSSSGRVVTVLRAGSPVVVSGRSGEWIAFLKDGTRLWIAAKHVSPGKTEPQIVNAPSRLSGSSQPTGYTGGSERAAPASAWFGKSCKRGKPCGNACIARDRVCHR